MKPEVTAFFEEDTNTVSYVVSEPEARQCAIIDSVLGFDIKAGRTNTDFADQIIDFVKSRDFQTNWILETHAHADHLSAAPYLKEKLGGKTGIGAHISDVQKIFSKIFNFDLSYRPDGSQFDCLFEDNDNFKIGDIDVRAIYTPGHTPACLTYLIDDAAFVGDTLFMPDYGTARVDFPGGDAATLYQSIQKIFDLPGEVRLFMCHDYKAPGRDHYAWETTVAEERSNNVHVGGKVSEAAFVELRMARDATLEMPKLLLPSVQINIRAGAFPPIENNGVSYLKLPLDQL